ncbi:hypothetical protein MYX65_05875 [Acidobacteria bacterium AH-259-L09]|nr:hypothetical protein [Acidobacteria bacterium AH-259-L09]
MGGQSTQGQSPISQPGSGGRPGRVNAAAEATAAEPGLQPVDPDPAAGAICAEPERRQSMPPGAGWPGAAERPGEQPRLPRRS